MVLPQHDFVHSSNLYSACANELTERASIRFLTALVADQVTSFCSFLPGLKFFHKVHRASIIEALVYTEASSMKRRRIARRYRSELHIQDETIQLLVCN